MELEVPYAEIPFTHEIGELTDEYVQMKDGTRLMTHVWLPRGEGRWPVIVQRNPYVDGGDGRDPGLMAFVRYGFAVVHQECRGRGSSEGDWEPFVNERQDGLDTLEWIARQPWQDGNIGLYGPSYMSFAQWVLADALPPEVKTMYISVIGTDQHRFMYMDGMFRPDIYTGWAVSNAGVDWAGRDLNEINDKAYRFRPQADMDEAILGKRLDWYRSILANPGSGDPLWADEPWKRLRTMPDKVAVPVCMTGGWFDIAIDAMFESYSRLRPGVREESRFVVGPWTHAMAPYGDLDYPEGQADGPNGGLKAAVNWFNHMLKGREYPGAKGVVRAYAIGENRWREWQTWPPRSAAKTFHLVGGTAESALRGGLSEEPSPEASEASYTYDPSNPVATEGGSGLLSVWGDSPYLPKAASVMQSLPGYRADVLTFLSEPLERPLPIAGVIRVVLAVASTADDTAFTAKISEVFPSGEAYNIADGISSLAYRNGSAEALTYEAGETVEAELTLWPIAWRLQPGSRLRLDVSSSNFPAYYPHANRAGNWALQAEPAQAVQTVRWGGQWQSRIELPVEVATDEGSD